LLTTILASFAREERGATVLMTAYPFLLKVPAGDKIPANETLTSEADCTWLSSPATMSSSEFVDVPTRPIVGDVGDAATIAGCTETYESRAVAQAIVQITVSLSSAERPVSAGAVKPQQASALAAPHEDDWVTAAVVLASPAGSDSLAHCDDQLVALHTWVVDGEPGAAVGSGVGRVAPENVAGCGVQTTVLVGYGWAPTRAPVHKAAR
jgi:hypothetical protein